jgi:serine/threonine protein kinase/alpha-beta hydrolase superfamily lysophospholipase
MHWLRFQQGESGRPRPQPSDVPSDGLPGHWFFAIGAIIASPHMLGSGSRLGPYEIVSFLGAGGMGDVYRARDSRLDRDVAVKVLAGTLAGDVEAVRRFEQEARAVAALSHPNVVSIFDFGTSGNHVFAVSELLEGETLRSRLGAGRMAWREACEIAIAIAEGLAAAHARGIVHRDLKPENVFIDREGRVKILDFGLAFQRTAGDGEEDGVTLRHDSSARGAIVGTAGYMAPEQIRGERAEASGDLFSFGCVLYEMLAGERAFPQKSSIEALAAILYQQPKPLAASGVPVPAALEQMVMQCLARDPAARLQSARDVARGLRSLLDAQTQSGFRSSSRIDSGSVRLTPAFQSSEALEVPITQYARSGDVNIAYQVLGEGPLDLVFVMGWITHLECFWQEPSFARFLRRLASFSRLILFDKRGTGLSDRVPLDELPTLEQRMDDVRAVMDAVGSHRAALCGVSEGGPLCALFAATYPEKTAALVMIGTYAKRIREDDDYPWAPTATQRQEFLDLMQREWGGPVGIAARAPSRADDPAFRDWWARYLRTGASPAAAVALTRMNAQIDVRHVLPTIRVPSLVIHRTGDLCLDVEEGRYVAERIPKARFVELPGNDHLPFVGDQDAIVDEVEEFLTGVRHAVEPDRVLATILHLRPVNTEASIDAHRIIIERELAWFRGRLVRLSGDALEAAFDGPARAVRCADALCRALAHLSFPVSAAVHTGECDLVGDMVSGVPLRIAESLASRAPAGAILVSSTVRDLVAGSGIEFEESGTASLGALGDWRLFRVCKA